MSPLDSLLESSLGSLPDSPLESLLKSFSLATGQAKLIRHSW